MVVQHMQHSVNQEAMPTVRTCSEQSVIEAFRSQQLDYVRTYDSYHLPIQRDGSWWVCEIRTQFRAERDFDNP
jgi:hypothetical protein